MDVASGMIGSRHFGYVEVDLKNCSMKIQAGLIWFDILSRVRNLPNTVMCLRALNDSGNLWSSIILAFQQQQQQQLCFVNVFRSFLTAL